MWVMMNAMPLPFFCTNNTVLIQINFYYFHSGCGCSDTLIALSFFFLSLLFLQEFDLKKKLRIDACGSLLIPLV